MRLYSVYYISADSCTCFGCSHPSSGARTTVITVVRAPYDGCEHPKHVELSTDM